MGKQGRKGKKRKLAEKLQKLLRNGIWSDTTIKKFQKEHNLTIKQMDELIKMIKEEL